MEERALFSVMIPHLSFHPHAFISLPTYFMSLTCSPSPSPSFSLSLSLSLSPQIIANHHMQSISFASGGDPVSQPNPVSQLKSHSRLFPSFFSQHALPPCLLSLSIALNTTHFIAALLDCLDCSPSFQTLSLYFVSSLSFL